MSDFELTGRGQSSILALSAFIIFALVFLDLVIFLLCFLLGVILVYDYQKVRSFLEQIDDFVEIEPGRVEATLTAGDIFSEELTVSNSSDLAMDLKIPLDNSLLDNFSSIKGSTSLDLVFTPQLVGEYQLKKIETEVEGRIGLINGTGKVSLELSFHVRPRILAAAIRAAEFLTSAKGIGSGDRPTKLKGAGLEYASSRKYQPGDEIRHLDWKATARLNRPIVKDFYLEGGEKVHLVFEATAPDPVSLDKLSSSFLNLTVLLARSGVPLDLTVHDGGRLKVHLPEANQREIVALALKHALEAVEVEVEELYTVLEPRTSRELRKMLRRLDEGPLREMLDIQLKALVGQEGSPYRALENLATEGGENLRIVLNSSLQGDIVPLLEFGQRIQDRGRELSILQPTQPWKNSDSLEESYRTRRRYSRIRRVLERRNFSLSGSVEKLSEELTSPRPPRQRISV